MTTTGRKHTCILNSLELIQSYEINLLSANEGIDSSQTSGKLLISVLSAVSEIERENIIEQTMNGRREKARQGGWNGGFAPYGYNLVDGKLIVVEDEANVIKEIFNLYVNQGYGADKIAKELNMKGIKKKVRQNGTLELWSRGTISRIIQNPVYNGKIAYGRRTKEKVKGTKNDYILEEGSHEAIIDDVLWNKTVEKVNSSKMGFKSIIGRDRIHLLSGILKCPQCGGPMYANKYCYVTKKGTYKEFYHYSCCHHKSQRGHPCSCNLKIQKGNIEPSVVELIKSLINNEEFIEQVISKISNETNNTKLINDKKKYEQQLKVNNENKRRLEVELDTLPLEVSYREKRIKDMNKRPDSLYDVIDDLEIRINDLAVKIASSELGKVTFDKVKEVITNFDKLYNLMTDEEKKTAISGIIKEIHLHKEPIKNNYIRSVKLKFGIKQCDSLEIELSGSVLNDINDLSLGYIENTYFESNDTKTYVPKPRKKKITYKMIQDYVYENYGLKVHSSNIAEVKRDLGLEMACSRQNGNDIKHVTKEKREAIADALKFLS